MVENVRDHRSARWKGLAVALLAVALVLANWTSAFGAPPSGWSVPTDLSASGADSTAPQITAAPDGALTALWTRNDGSNWIVQASSSTDQGVTWSTVANLSASGGDAENPQITAASDGTLTAIWSRHDGSNWIVQSSSSTDRGVTWSAPADLSASGGNASSPQITVAPDNTFTAIWLRRDGSNRVVQASSSTDQGVTWSTATNIATAVSNASFPQITAASDGTLTAIWSRHDGSNWIVQSSSSTDQGITWSTVTNRSAAAGNAENAQITVAPDGTFTAIWSRFDGANWYVQSSSSADQGITWSTVTDLSASGGNAQDPQITVAPDGTLAAIWRRQVGGNRTVQSSSSTDQGVTWSTVTNITTGGNANAPQVTVAPDGTITAIWRRNDGSNEIVQASSSTDQGTTWSTVTNLSVVGGDAYDPQITAASNSTLTTVWRRYDGSNYVIQSSFGLTAPLITSTNPPASEVGAAYSFQFTASGTPAPTFTVSSGALPVGLTLSPAGLLSGTPTEAGDFSFTITASNGVTPAAVATYTLAVAAILVATGGNISTPIALGGLLALGAGTALTLLSRLRRHTVRVSDIRSEG